MDNPYKKLPDRAFWAPSVGHVGCLEIADLWRPKWPIGADTPIATYGSCFAQHIGQALRDREFAWLDAEPAPVGLPVETRRSYGYEQFSARTGNIYTSSLLNQWVRWALSEESPPEIWWEEEGRVYDPFRPTIEPHGFASKAEMLTLRCQAIESFRESITHADVLVFTLGLTESWFDVDGWEYPMCPGTVAGEFRPKRHRFSNQSYKDVWSALGNAMDLMRKVNPELKIVLTVSPVPLTATNSGDHVLVSTMYSKSILRAVAGEMAGRDQGVDYFPSYEIINSPAYEGMFFESNKRSVSKFGVKHVMDAFFTSLGQEKRGNFQNDDRQDFELDEDASCDEELLDAFRAMGEEGK